MRLLIFAECNTEETIATLLFRDIENFTVKHRGGLSLLLKAFDKTIEKEGDNDYDLIGMICDLERGTIMEESVRKILNKHFQDEDKSVITDCGRGRIYLYKKGKLFAVVFDPKFEEALSCLSNNFRDFYEKYRSKVKKVKFRERLEKAMLNDRNIRRMLSVLKRELIGMAPAN